MTSTTVPSRLVDCKTVMSQRSWIARALRAGQVLSDTELWLAGVDEPERLIAQLKSDDLQIVTTTKRMMDAADEAHDDLAWCLVR